MSIFALSETQPREQMRRIIATVAELRGCSVEELTGACRAHDIVPARHFAMFAIRQMTKASYPRIGRQFGARHHTSVIYGVRKARQEPDHERDLTTVERALEAAR